MLSFVNIKKNKKTPGNQCKHFLCVTIQIAVNVLYISKLAPVENLSIYDLSLVFSYEG